MADIYYKLLYYISENGKPKVTVATLQWFDEIDDNDKYLKDEDGDDLLFYNEEEAVQWLLDNFQENEIDSEYLNK